VDGREHREEGDSTHVHASYTSARVRRARPGAGRWEVVEELSSKKFWEVKRSRLLKEEDQNEKESSLRVWGRPSALLLISRKTRAPSLRGRTGGNAMGGEDSLNGAAMRSGKISAPQGADHRPVKKIKIGPLKAAKNSRSHLKKGGRTRKSLLGREKRDK